MDLPFRLASGSKASSKIKGKVDVGLRFSAESSLLDSVYAHNPDMSSRWRHAQEETRHLNCKTNKWRQGETLMFVSKPTYPYDPRHKLFSIWSFPKKRKPQYRPQNTIVLIIGTPKMVPIILGNPHMTLCHSSFEGLRARHPSRGGWPSRQGPGPLGSSAMKRVSCLGLKA